MLLRGLHRISYIEDLKQFMILATSPPLHPPTFFLCHDFANIVPTPGQVSFSFLYLALPEDSDGCLFL